MAAPYKTGLDYYPRKVNFVNDRRFIGLRIKWGNRALGIYEQILDAVYSERGYYISIRDRDREALIRWLWMNYGNFDGLTCEDIEEMITAMVDEELFDRDMYKRGILTSHEIQEVFYTATLKRKSITVNEDIWLISEERMRELGKSSPIYKYFHGKINDVINPQSKVNQSKPKETKPEETKPPKEGAGENPVEELGRKYFGTLTQRDLERVRAWGGGIDTRVIEAVFKLTRDKGKGFYYADGVVKRLISQGTLTWEDYVKRELSMSEPVKPPVRTTRFVNYNQPVYTDEEIEAAIARKKRQREEERRREELSRVDNNGAGEGELPDANLFP